jgi:hypothetical protein
MLGIVPPPGKVTPEGIDGIVWVVAPAGSWKRLLGGDALYLLSWKYCVEEMPEYAKIPLLVTQYLPVLLPLTVIDRHVADCPANEAELLTTLYPARRERSDDLALLRAETTGAAV